MCHVIVICARAACAHAALVRVRSSYYTYDVVFTYVRPAWRVYRGKEVSAQLLQFNVQCDASK